MLDVRGPTLAAIEQEPGRVKIFYEIGHYGIDKTHFHLYPTHVPVSSSSMLSSEGRLAHIKSQPQKLAREVGLALAR